MVAFSLISKSTKNIRFFHVHFRCKKHVLVGLKNHALIRELHVYGIHTNIGIKQIGNSQHTGLGSKLLKYAEELALKPVARILGHSTHAQKPSEFTSAPVGAIGNLFEKINMNINDFDIFEINEAFAVVTMIAMKELSINHSKVNIYGGACALGHPIGASGTRIIVTLLNALKKEGKRWTLAERPLTSSR